MKINCGGNRLPQALVSRVKGIQRWWCSLRAWSGVHLRALCASPQVPRAGGEDRAPLPEAAADVPREVVKDDPAGGARGSGIDFEAALASLPRPLLCRALSSSLFRIRIWYLYPQLENAYGISATPDPEHAAGGTSPAERQRLAAERLLRLGFEGALAETKHNNATGRVPTRAGFEVVEPCCKVEQCGGNEAEYPQFPKHGECGKMTDFKCAPDGHELLPEDYVYPPVPGVELDEFEE